MLSFMSAQPLAKAELIDFKHLFNDLESNKSYLENKSFSNWTNYSSYILAITTILACVAIGRYLMPTPPPKKPKTHSPYARLLSRIYRPKPNIAQRVDTGPKTWNADLLFQAVVDKDTEAVRKILTLAPKGESDFINSVHSNGSSPLLAAICSDNKKMISLLLENGADCNIPDNDGNTPLIKAADRDDDSLVQLLLNKGAKPELHNNQKLTALHLAASKKNLAMVNHLLASSSRENFINLTDDLGRTPLYMATEAKKLKIVKLLLNHNADPNLSDTQGLTPLALATYANSFKIFKELLKKSNIDSINKFYQKTTLLAYAISFNKLEFTKELVTSGADMHQSHEFVEYQTPFMQACSLGNVEVIDVLLNADTQKRWVSITDEFGKNALHCAIDSKNHKAVEALLKAGADIMHINAKGLTPLMSATEAGNKKMVSLILEYDKDLRCAEYKDINRGTTALKIAEMKDFKEIVNLIRGHLKFFKKSFCDTSLTIKKT